MYAAPGLSPRTHVPLGGIHDRIAQRRTHRFLASLQPLIERRVGDAGLGCLCVADQARIVDLVAAKSKVGRGRGPDIVEVSNDV